jgi:hypothetical protein
MSYLSQPTTKTEYGVVQIGNYIEVINGIISLSQDLSSNASVIFDNLNVTTGLSANGRSVITTVTPTAGAGIEITDIISDGYEQEFTISNTGVLSLTAGPGITLSGSTGNISISSIGADLINVVGVTGNYTATPTDEYIGVSSSIGVTILLPAGINGRTYTIKDEYGQGAGKITIRSMVNELVDNKMSYVISVPYQSVSVVFRGTSWWLI